MEQKLRLLWEGSRHPPSHKIVEWVKVDWGERKDLETPQTPIGLQVTLANETNILYLRNKLICTNKKPNTHKSPTRKRSRGPGGMRVSLVPVVPWIADETTNPTQQNSKKNHPAESETPGAKRSKPQRRTQKCDTNQPKCPLKGELAQSRRKG